MAFVYLINRLDTKEYKIGISKSDPHKRLKQLQTGSGMPLQIINFFKTETPFKLEKLLHLYYSLKKTEANNEWFILEDNEVFEFPKICKTKQDIIDYMLKFNPFYK